ncbi:fimbria/pilus periplasmic chaperone [Serratia inhibens]|uniref:fimbria/pilus periplasmic chaperone n=1 Tax=Serratia inhibens TaxID=2338073 RepID=UPI0005C61A05|nr:fimbria/pilus periplasmic chaperone [Serratia inhibens]ANS44533.1 putative fimbrial chaperone YadV [Serratia inhibens PRI-2C]
MLNLLLFIAVFISAVHSAVASMTISGTRIVFPASEKEVNVRTINKGSLPALVQVWVDEGQTSADLNSVKIPFIVTPPVYRVEPGKGQSVRMIYNGMTLPQDRESVFWFNLLEIPPKSKNTGSEQKLELAFRTRIKIFYRPVTLEKSNSELEKNKLQWDVVNDTQRGTGVKLTNMTPYYFSFDSASIVSHGRKLTLSVDMVAPNSSRVFFPENKLSGGEKISEMEYRLLNDYGAPVSTKIKWEGTQSRIMD